MNIILLVSDTYRFDNLFDRADMPVRTPCLDSFASRAVSMEQFYTGSFPTIPQRTDMTSGRYGWPWYGWQALDASTRNSMPGILGSSGYVSQLICDCPHLFNARFQHTFTAAEALRGQEGDLYHLRMNHAIEAAMPREKTRAGDFLGGHALVDIHCWQNRDWAFEGDRLAPRTAETAVRWLEENYRHDPFLLWVDFFDPHEPWDPPEYMVRRYDPDYDGPPMLHPNYGPAGDYTAAELRNLRAHYCAEAEMVDRWVGRVLEKIDDLGLWENSVVVFTTDHGMSLGEHDRTGKTNINKGDKRMWPIYPEVAHIPFMVAAPGLEGGRDVRGFAQPVDILPTLLDLAGVDVTPPEPFHGRSFAGALRGEQDGAGRDFAVSASYLRLKRKGRIPACATTPVLYTNEWAYAPLGTDGACELFRLASDPGADTNVVAEHADVAADLHRRLVAWLGELDAPARLRGTLEARGPEASSG